MADAQHWLVIIILGLSPIVFLSVWFVIAPYGRHARGGWGPTLPSLWAWVLMESPAVLAFAATWALVTTSPSIPELALVSLWLLHYLDRTLLYPARAYKKSDKRTPASVALMGFVFNCINGFNNGFATSQSDAQFDIWLTLGSIVFVLGFGANRWADAVLRKLRQEKGGYGIPRGGLYEVVSCPNYLSELLMWTGFAIASQTLAAWAFVLFTAANLVPRARSHHLWYRATFEDYPEKRRALVPGVF